MATRVSVQAPVVVKKKTGGRKAGTPNKPKPQAAAPAPAPAAARGRRGGAAAAAVPNVIPQARVRARDAITQRIRMARTDALIAFPGNARTHDAAQIAKLAASIRQFGFTNPILTDGRLGVLAGHGRLAAAKQLAMVLVPTLSLGHLTAKQQSAYVLADNRLALDAGWDEGLLIEALGTLQSDGFDVGLIGFDAAELEDLLGEPAPPPAPRQKTAMTTMTTCPKCNHSFKL